MWKPEPPEAVAKTIQSYTRADVPNFFIYAKDKLDEQVESPVENTTMARIVTKIPDPKPKYCKTVGRFDYRMLMNQNCGGLLSDDNSIVKAYDYCNTHRSAFNEENVDCKDDDLYVYRQLRQKILDDSGMDVDVVVNTLVMVLYTVRKASNKKLLWSCFGNEMVENLKHNLEGKGLVCPICGRRFMPRANANTTYCSDECATNAKLEYDRQFREENG